MSDRYRFGPFELDASEHSFQVEGRPVALTRRAFDTLLYLVRHPGRLVTRDELIAAVWGDTIVEEGNLHWTISAVRKTLAQESEESRIETVRGLGYRFLGPVEPLGEAAPAGLPGPPRRHFRRLWLAAGVATLLIGGLVWMKAGWLGTAAASRAPRGGVGGFPHPSPGGAGGGGGAAAA